MYFLFFFLPSLILQMSGVVGLFFGPVWEKSNINFWNSAFKETKKCHYEKSVHHENGNYWLHCLRM